MGILVAAKMNCRVGLYLLILDQPQALLTLKSKSEHMATLKWLTWIFHSYGGEGRSYLFIYYLFFTRKHINLDCFLICLRENLYLNIPVYIIIYNIYTRFKIVSYEQNLWFFLHISSLHYFCLSCCYQN